MLTPNGMATALQATAEKVDALEAHAAELAAQLGQARATITELRAAAEPSPDRPE